MLRILRPTLAQTRRISLRTSIDDPVITNSLEQFKQRLENEPDQFMGVPTSFGWFAVRREHFNSIMTLEAEALEKVLSPKKSGVKLDKKSKKTDKEHYELLERVIERDWLLSVDQKAKAEAKNTTTRKPRATTTKRKTKSKKDEAKEETQEA